MSSKLLNTTLSQFSGRKRVKGDVGIEVELEGNLKNYPSKIWRVEEEGSLRGGLEFVLHKPVDIKNLPNALEDLQRVLKDSRPAKTIRCSTHVHVNCGDFTLKEIYKFLFVYYLLEDFLVETQGPTRIGNLFCLRMSDAEAVKFQLRNSLEDEEYLAHFNLGGYKYGALNLGSFLNLNTAEFRFLLPMHEEKPLLFWTTLLYELVHKAPKIPFKEVLLDYEIGRPEGLLRRVWGDSTIQVLSEKNGCLGNLEKTRELLTTNFDDVASLYRTFERKSRFRMDKRLMIFDPDLHEEATVNPGTISTLDTGQPISWNDLEVYLDNQL